jgi:hypothetical protein
MPLGSAPLPDEPLDCARGCDEVENAPHEGEKRLDLRPQCGEAIGVRGEVPLDPTPRFGDLSLELTAPSDRLYGPSRDEPRDNIDKDLDLRRGSLVEKGLALDVMADAFRREPLSRREGRHDVGFQDRHAGSTLGVCGRRERFDVVVGGDGETAGNGHSRGPFLLVAASESVPGRRVSE